MSFITSFINTPYFSVEAQPRVVPARRPVVQRRIQRVQRPVVQQRVAQVCTWKIYFYWEIF